MDGNRSVIERFEHAFVKNDQATLNELLDPNMVDHTPAPGGTGTKEGFMAQIDGYTSAFENLTIDLQSTLLEGDEAATRWTVTGTHSAEFAGVPATGKTVTVGGMNFYKLANGKITDVWTQFDAMSLMMQIGAIPMPA